MSFGRPSGAAAALLAFVVSLPAAAPLYASCGASSCEMDVSAAAPRAERSGRLGYEFEFVPQNRRWSGRTPAPPGAKGGHHDEVYSVSRVHRLSASLGLSPAWSVSAQVPLIERSHGHVHHHRGAQLAQAWSVSGLGDVLVEARYAFWRSRGGSVWSVAAGSELPTGRDAAANEAGAPAEDGILPGSGSFDASAGLLWQRPVGRAALFASAARRFNGPGEKGYRQGDLMMFHAGGAVPLKGRWSGLLQASVVLRERDWQGSTREETVNTGGEALFLSPGVEFAAGRGWSVSAAVQVPVYQRVNGFQIVSDYALRAGLGYRFSL